MERLLFLLFLSFLNFGFAQEKKPVFKDYFNEFHISMNHGIPLRANDRTFFGAGLGANKVFRAEKIISFRTGLEFQLFHYWEATGEPAHFSHTENIHSLFLDLSVPLVMRINVGYFFVELGGNLGIGVGGQKSEMVSNFPPNKPAVTKEEKSKTGSGFWLGPAAGIGTLIPLNEKLDLLIRPDVQLNFYVAERIDLFARLSIGIHLK